jgi:hypothetical protein
MEKLIEQSSKHNYSHKHVYSILTDVKSRVGLLKSSNSVMKLIKYIENFLIELICYFTLIISGLSIKIIISAKLYDYTRNFNILQNITCSNNSFLENHRLYLITLIYTYVYIYIFVTTRKMVFFLQKY